MCVTERELKRPKINKRNYISSLENRLIDMESRLQSQNLQSSPTDSKTISFEEGYDYGMPALALLPETETPKGHPDGETVFYHVNRLNL